MKNKYEYEDLTEEFQEFENDLPIIDIEEIEKLQMLLNIMYPFFSTSKTSFLIALFYDTSGNSFTPSESKLLAA